MPLDPIIHQPTRLQIMAALFRNRESSFAMLRDALGLTDGNLGSHAAALERAGYVASRRALTPRGFEVRYRITREGSAAFISYTRELKTLLDPHFNDPSTLVIPTPRLDAAPEAPP